MDRIVLKFLLQIHGRILMVTYTKVSRQTKSGFNYFDSKHDCNVFFFFFLESKFFFYSDRKTLVIIYSTGLNNNCCGRYTNKILLYFLVKNNNVFTIK